MKILFIGDLVGSPGRELVADRMADTVQSLQIDLVIANGENSAAGHAHGPSDSGTRRFSIGSKDRRVQHLRCRPTPEFILANVSG